MTSYQHHEILYVEVNIYPFTEVTMHKQVTETIGTINMTLKLVH